MTTTNQQAVSKNTIANAANAADRYRRYCNGDDIAGIYPKGASPQLHHDEAILAYAYHRELDQSEITPILLAQHGWSQAPHSHGWRNGVAEIWPKKDGFWLLLHPHVATDDFKTIGVLLTAMRLGQQDRQSSTTSTREV